MFIIINKNLFELNWDNLCQFCNNLVFFNVFLWEDF